MEQDQRRLQAQKTLFPTYVNLKDAETNLAGTAETSLFSEDALTKLDKQEVAVSNLEKQTKDEVNELRELEQKRDSLVYDDRIIGVEPSIFSLQREIERFKSASKDISEVGAHRATLANSVRTKIEKLGPEWTEERVRDFNLSHLQEDQSRTAKDQISEARRKIQNIKSKLEAHLDSKAGEASRGVRISPFLRNTGYLSVALGATGFTLGFIFSQPALSVFSACLLIVGLILALSGRKPSPSLASDPLERKYANDLSSTESDYRKISGEWQGQLRSIGLNESLSPDGALDVVRTITEIQSDQDELDRLDSRTKAMQDAIDAVNNLLNQVVDSLGKTKISDDVVASIEILAQQLILYSIQDGINPGPVC